MCLSSRNPVIHAGIITLAVKASAQTVCQGPIKPVFNEVLVVVVHGVSPPVLGMVMATLEMHVLLILPLVVLHGVCALRHLQLSRLRPARALGRRIVLL